MNEVVAVIKLHEVVGAADAWGNRQGREAYSKLLEIVEANPGAVIFRVSLAGIERNDASFPRESVVALAKRFRGHRGFCLVDVTDPDLLDNWDAAALKLEQPIHVWSSDGTPRLLGPKPPSGGAAMLEYVLGQQSATASRAAKELKLQITNASSKLKQLCEQGFILRREDTAASGGVEYTYFGIR